MLGITKAYSTLSGCEKHRPCSYTWSKLVTGMSPPPKSVLIAAARMRRLHSNGPREGTHIIVLCFPACSLLKYRDPCLCQPSNLDNYCLLSYFSSLWYYYCPDSDHARFQQLAWPNAATFDPHPDRLQYHSSANVKDCTRFFLTISSQLLPTSSTHLAFFLPSPS